MSFPRYRAVLIAVGITTFLGWCVLTSHLNAPIVMDTAAPLLPKRPLPAVVSDRDDACVAPPRTDKKAAGRPAASAAVVHVLTQRNDNRRTGNNLRETRLNTRTVNTRQFGKLFSREVDGDIYAQPLYVSNLKFAKGRTRNVVFVATAHNSVYAFDADDAKAAAPLWQARLGRSVPNTDVGQAIIPYTDFATEIGITGTPVIDAANKTLYVVAKTKDPDQVIRQRLHALDLTTGREKISEPRNIRASVPGAGDGAKDGVLSFNPQTSNQRASLLLTGGVVYVAWAGHADTPPYHGWIIGYDARTLKQVSAWVSTPDGEGGGIWMSGTGLSADGNGHIYAVVGDGTFSAAQGALEARAGRDYGDSFVKLSTAGNRLTVADFYAPHDQESLNRRDVDLGSCGALLIPGTTTLLSGSKSGDLFHLDTKRMGGYLPQNGDRQILQRTAAAPGNIYGTPLFWNDPCRGLSVFVWGGSDHLKTYRIRDGRLQAAPVAQSAVAAPSSKPGGFLSLSADGNQSGTGIVWASHPFKGDANRETVPGILRAFAAEDVTRELWNSRQNEARDDVGNFGKFCMPTVANGKVYLGTFSNRLNVYGLLPSAAVKRRAI